MGPPSFFYLGSRPILISVSFLARLRRENHNLIADHGVKAATDFYSKAGELIAPLQETDYVGSLCLVSLSNPPELSTFYL